MEVWRDVKAMIDSRQFSEAYVLGVIDASSKLTDVQKIKMRDEAKAFMTPEHVPEAAGGEASSAPGHAIE